MKNSTFNLIMNLVRHHLAEEIPTNSVATNPELQSQMPPVFKNKRKLKLGLIRRKSSVFPGRQS